MPRQQAQAPVVYEFQCDRCDASYVGYTREHFFGVQAFYQKKHSDIIPDEHCDEKLKKRQNKFDCLVNKLLYIKQLRPSLNVQSDSEPLLFT